jgi:hypothetical protein
MAEMGYDTIVRIRDAEAFVRAVSNSLAKVERVRPGVLARVQYCGRAQMVDEPGLPAEIVKDARYAHQCEWRAIWPTVPGWEPGPKAFAR